MAALVSNGDVEQVLVVVDPDVLDGAGAAVLPVLGSADSTLSRILILPIALQGTAISGRRLLLVDEPSDRWGSICCPGKVLVRDAGGGPVRRACLSHGRKAAGPGPWTTP
ncbi:hypothetical protein AB0950_36935 [Streptomyces sp. NPDC007189]|uniref:hypothetical protein n=1 Tax=unclassified Streptomyces TaxID=2593676 RepID=UPI0033F08474